MTAVEVVAVAEANVLVVQGLWVCYCVLKPSLGCAGCSWLLMVVAHDYLAFWNLAHLAHARVATAILLLAAHLARVDSLWSVVAALVVAFVCSSSGYWLSVAQSSSGFIMLVPFVIGFVAGCVGNANWVPSLVTLS
ncbi:hypothetical protein U1Q18_023268 [Sarracenia purpurea var. burkii]